MSQGPFLYPNVTSVPSQGVERSRDVKTKDPSGGEFDRVLGEVSQKSGDKASGAVGAGLENIKTPLKFSAHATQRLRDRKIALDPTTLAKVNDAVDRAEAKGIEDTLVLTSDAALIVSVKNRTVITALDRGAAMGNVFTNIDGAVIV